MFIARNSPSWSGASGVEVVLPAPDAAGASYDDVVSAGPTSEYEAKWGDPERFLTAVYAELAGD